MKFRFTVSVLLVLLMPGLPCAQTAADADFDGNGTVDFPDFLQFARAYNTTQVKYDLNKNGTVDFPDFLAFVRVFGQKATTQTTPPSVGQTFNATLPGNATMEFVYIQPGKFLMGSPSTEVGRESDEGPQHEVTITKGFYIDKYEVTQGQWQAVMNTTPWSKQSYVQANPDHPAVCVSWEDAQVFIHKLNVAAGDSVYRLPTEAEWEYACRAGTTTRWSFGDDSTKVGEYAWYIDNAWNVGKQYAQKVGTKKPNPWGLYDMHGNVWEWVQDWWWRSYSGDAQVDPAGPVSGSHRVGRGGDFSNYAGYTRSAIRGYDLPFNRYYLLGFRLLRRAN